MATISDPEATQILTQLSQIQTQLTNKAKLSAVNADITSLRAELDTEQSNIAALITRLANAQAALTDLEARVRALGG